MSLKTVEQVLIEAKPLVESRVWTLSEVKGWVQFLLIDELPNYKTENLIPKNDTAWSAHVFLLWSQSHIINHGLEGAEEYLRRWSLCHEVKPANVFWSLRVAISGKTISLPLFESMKILGKDETVKRLQIAMDKLQELKNASS